MSGLEKGLLAFGILLLLLALRVPVAFAMAAVAAGGIWLTVGDAFLFTTFATTPYAIASDYTFVVVPLFVLMGGIATRAGIIADLYTAAAYLLNKVKGSLLIATILAQGAFAAASGSTVVASSVFTRMALPEMQRFGYNMGIAGGAIAAGGTLAGLIPPSVAMVLFSMLTAVPVGKLLVAGIVPGLLTGLVYIIGVRLMVQIRPEIAPPGKLSITRGMKLQAISRTWSIVLLMGLIMGGIYGGFYAPSAAGAIGAAGVLIIALIMRRLKKGDFFSALQEAARISGMIFLIVIAGLIFSRFLIISGFIGELRGVVTAMEIGPVGFMAATIVVMLLLGMFVDSVSLMVITIPFLFPISQALNIDPIWFAVIVVKMVEIGAITPPVGLNLYAVLASAEGRVSTAQLFRGVLPFVLMEAALMALLLAVPALSTWLPDSM